MSMAMFESDVLKRSSLGRSYLRGATFPWASKRILAILALLLVNVIWSSTYVVTKPLLEHIPPLTIAAARFVILLVILLPILARSGSRPARGPAVALMGLTGVFLVYFCQNIGLQYTTASNAALLEGSLPIFTVLLAAPMIGERLNLGRLVGVASSLAGVVAIVTIGGHAGLSLSVFGDSMLAASSAALAVYLVVGRRASLTADSLALVAGAAIYGLLFLLPASAVELAVVGVPRPGAVDLAGLVYLGAIASALAFVLWGYALRHLEAGQAASFSNIGPLIGVALAALLLGEPIGAAQIAGGALILTGVYLATRLPRSTPAQLRSAYSDHA